MVVYYSILVFILYLGVIKKLSEKYEKSDHIIVAAAVLLMLFFAAMRGIHVGADTSQYCSHFLKLAETRWSDFSTYRNSYYGNLELGYKVMNKLLSVFRHQQTITIVNSILQMGLIAAVIYKQSKDKWLSIFLYFSFCFYQTALNLTPSSYVSYFLFLTFPYIKDKKLMKFLIFIGIGMLFHTSAIFFLPLYFMSKLEINKKTLAIVFGTAGFIFVFYTLFIKIISFVLPQKYLVYIDISKEHKVNSVELLVLLVQILAIAFCLMQLDKNKLVSILKEENIVVWMLIYEVLLYMLSVMAAMFQRGAFLFSPYFIIIIPELISRISNKQRQWLTEVAMVAYGTALYIIRVSINNVGKTIPYEFFFNE